MGTGNADHSADSHSELRSLLARIVESSSDAIFSMTLDGRITSWNAGAQALFGYTAEEVTGREMAALFPADRPGELVPVLDQIRRGERVGNFETKRVRKDGTIIDVSVSVSPIHDSGGTIRGAAAVVRDVTERRWLESERQETEARRHEAERVASLSRFAGAVGHDFTLLLGDIMGCAACVAEATAGALPGVQADLWQLQTAAGHAARLAKDLLAFGGRTPTRPEKLDLNAVLASMRRLLEVSLGIRIDLRLITTPGLPAVLADRGQIGQVLLNLAVNAIEAMPLGGTLTVTTGLADLDKVHDLEWPELQPGPYVELAVNDNGYGMDAETMRCVFEPFFTTKQPHQGAGLGLSAVYGVVTKVGGGIAIDSEEGMGTTIHIYLPALTARGPDSPLRLPPSAAGRGETILVAAAHLAELEITARILRHNGYRVLAASTGEEALLLLSVYDVQLLVADTALPGMPGPALAEWALELMPGIKVLCTSETASAAANQDTGTSSAVPVLRKPFTARELAERVRGLLSAATASPDG